MWQGLKKDMRMTNAHRLGAESPIPNLQSQSFANLRSASAARVRIKTCCSKNTRETKTDGPALGAAQRELFGGGNAMCPWQEARAYQETTVGWNLIFSFLCQPVLYHNRPSFPCNHMTRMNLCSELRSQPHPLVSRLPLCRRSGGAGLGTPDLGGLALLDGLLALADGGGAGDGVLAEVGAVVAVGGRLDDGRVGLAGAPAGGKGSLLDVGCGLVALAGLLGQEDNAALGTGLDADGLYRWSISCSLCSSALVPSQVGARVVLNRTLSSTRPSYCARISQFSYFRQCGRRTLREYWFLRLSGSRENWMPPD